MMFFTERETEVLTLLAQGRTNKQIATALGISDFTVRDHVSSLLRKSSVKTRTELVFCGMQGRLPQGTLAFSAEAAVAGGGRSEQQGARDGHLDSGDHPPT